jgi:hypothetical protein
MPNDINPVARLMQSMPQSTIGRRRTLARIDRLLGLWRNDHSPIDSAAWRALEHLHTLRDEVLLEEERLSHAHRTHCR